jgi:hypothetical protein
MADTKVSALTAATAALATMEIPVNDAGVSKKVTVQQLMDLEGDSVGPPGATADQAIAAATLTLVAGSVITIPAAKLRAGSILKWRIVLAKAAVGVASRNVFVRLGTAGTTADTAVLTFASPVPTAAADEGYMDIQVTVRAATSTATLQGMLVLMHNGNTVGLATVPVVVQRAVSGAVDVTVASLKASISITTGASETLTIYQVLAEAKYL